MKVEKKKMFGVTLIDFECLICNKLLPNAKAHFNSGKKKKKKEEFSSYFPLFLCCFILFFSFFFGLIDFKCLICNKLLANAKAHFNSGKKKKVSFFLFCSCFLFRSSSFVTLNQFEQRRFSLYFLFILFFSLVFSFFRFSFSFLAFKRKNTEKTKKDAS